MNAGVIKSAEAVQLAAVLAPLELRDVRAESAALLDAARREAAQITRRAAGEVRGKVAEALETARRRGHEAGYQVGLEAGQAQGRAEALSEARRAFAEDARSALAALDEINRQWQARHREWFVDARHDVAALAIAIARRIAPRLPDLDAELASQTCRAALAALGRVHEVTIYAHPRDLQALRTLHESAAGMLHEAGAIRWAADESVGRGGVRLESPIGSVDASVLRQVERIADELLEGWRERMATWGDTSAARTDGDAPPGGSRPEGARIVESRHDGDSGERADAARLAGNPPSAVRRPLSPPESP